MSIQILARKPGESIYIGDEITIKVLDVQGLQVRVEINSPDSISILKDGLAGRERVSTQASPSTSSR